MKEITKNVKILILTIFVLVLLYLSIIEIKNILIDRYNFGQLEKVKDFLDTNEKEEYRFRSLKDFNYKYNLDIYPIKNCYYMATTNYFNNYNGKSSYIFGFKLESITYKIRYLKLYYYAYPKYDLPVDKIPNRGGDIILANFIGTISNPCQD